MIGILFVLRSLLQTVFLLIQGNYFGPMSLRAQICSSPIEDMTVTIRSFPSANPSLICMEHMEQDHQSQELHLPIAITSQEIDFIDYRGLEISLVHKKRKLLKFYFPFIEKFRVSSCDPFLSILSKY